VKGPFRFTKKERINHPQDFKRVTRLGKRIQSQRFIVFIHENRLGFHRMGIVVKKEVGPAAYRNRIKRYFREFFRLNKDRVSGSFDMVIMAKRGYSLKQYREAEEELKGLLRI